MTTDNKRLLVILLLVMAVGTALFFSTRKNNAPTSTQITDQTANWKTYSDKALMVSFKYPETWNVSAQAPGSDYYVTIENFIPKSATAPLEKNQIAIFINEGLRDQNAHSVKLSGIDTLENLIATLADDKTQVITEQKTSKINGYETLSRTVTYQTAPNKSTKEIYILDGNGKVMIITRDGGMSSFDNIFDQILSSFVFAAQATGADVSSWIVYENKTFDYSIKFPTTYQVPPQTEKQKSQVGIDNNVCVRKNTAGIECVVIIDSFKNSDNLSLEDYLNKNLKMFGLFEATNPLASPLVSYKFNGYDALFNKSQYVFVKHGQYVYHINAPKASSDKEVGDVVATFKFTQ